MRGFCRKTLLPVFLALTSSAVADYPILSHRYLADPAVLVHNGRVYLYCSNDDENIGHEDYQMRSLVCVSSDDLKNWTDHGVVFRVPDDAAWASRSWAPSVIARNDQFYLYFGNAGSGIGVATSVSPIGPFEDPIGGLLVSHSTPGASGPNMWLFDPYAFIDDDGQAYLYFGGNGESNARIIRLNDDMTSVDGPAVSLIAPGFFEAAWMHKRGSLYYFTYSTDPAHGLRIDYMTSDNPLSGFVYGGIVADQPPSNNNNNHHGIFEFEGSWYHVYHNRFVARERGEPPGFLRNLGLESLEHLPDGSIQPVTYTRDSLKQVRHLDPYQQVEGETFAGQSGARTRSLPDGGMALSELTPGDWVQIRGVNFKEGAERFEARVSSPGAEGALELRLDGLEGPIIGACTIPAASEAESWTLVECPVDPETAAGTHDLYLVAAGIEAEATLAIDWWRFDPAQTAPPPPESITASPISRSQIRIEWAPAPGSDSYAVERALAPEGPYSTIATELAEPAYTDSNLELGPAYYYRIVASNEAGAGAPSDPLQAQPALNYEEWIDERLGPPLDPALAAAEADPDQDGLPNLLEYFQGSDPLASSMPVLSLGLAEDGLPVLRLRRSRSLAWVEASIQSAREEEPWETIELPYSIALETADAVILESPLLDPAKSTRYRVRVDLVASP